MLSRVDKNTKPLAWHIRIITTALMYNIVTFVAFLIVYLSMDFSRHFSSPQPVTLAGKVYYAVMVHTTIGSGEIYPKTDLARSITAVHAMLSWAQLLLVFVA